MNIETISMPREAARVAFREYQAELRQDRGATRKLWAEQDEALMRGYRALAKGLHIIGLVRVMKMAGLREDEWPKLAVTRSSAPKVFCQRYHDGSACFQTHDRLRWRCPKSERVLLPSGTFPTAIKAEFHTVSTVVPMIPPHLRPKHNLANYLTLWEVESWTPEPPRDPMLLQHLGGWLYVVLATWDLTELERAVLGARAV